MNISHLLEDISNSKTHTYISRSVVDIGIVLFMVSGVYSLYTNSIHWEVFLFAGISLFGAGLYLPSYFIGQELFDAGGVSVVFFIYLCGILISGSIILQVYVITNTSLRLTTYILLMIVIFSGLVRAEVEEII